MNTLLEHTNTLSLAADTDDEGELLEGGEDKDMNEEEMDKDDMDADEEDEA